MQGLIEMDLLNIRTPEGRGSMVQGKEHGHRSQCRVHVLPLSLCLDVGRLLNF